MQEKKKGWLRESQPKESISIIGFKKNASKHIVVHIHNRASK